MKLTVLYDNEAEKGLRKGHGFSCLIDNGEKILFDTGWDGLLLLSNMKKLSVNVKEVNSIFLSHNHWDHLGGLPTVLNFKKNLEVFYPKWFSKNLKREVKARAKLKEVSTPTKIVSGFYTTGELGEEIKEQSLIVKTEKGNIVVTGCSHPGLRTILERSLRFGKIFGVIGGFHGFNEYSILKRVQLIVPCHCTQHKKEIKRLYPKNCEIGFAGKIIEI